MRSPATHPRLLTSSLTVTALLFSAGLATMPGAAAAGTDSTLSGKIRPLMQDYRVQNATSAAVVVDGTTGSELYSRYAARPTTPASNTKILTAVAAMDTLGPGYTFKTDVIRRGSVVNGTLRGNLYLKGYGDPTTLRSDFQSLAEQVKAAGIRRVTHQVVADASFFDSTRYNPYWSTSYASDYYAAQISGLTAAPDTDYDSGTVLVNYQPGSVGSRAKITLTPASASRYVTVRNNTVTGSSGSSNTFSARRTPDTNVITVGGRVPAGRGTSKEWVTVNKPELYAAALFRAELVKLGIVIDGGTKIMTTPASSRIRVARDRSMTLSAMLVPFMKFSNNMHAETLTKTMARQTGRPGNWVAGLGYTKRYMAGLGAPMTGIVLNDGSGLTRTNKITPRAMGVVLHKVQRESWFPAFYASLPVAANPNRLIGGTLANRMRSTAAANNAHAKTGSLTGVTALSGYVSGADGHRYIFSMLSQYSGTSPRPVEDKLVVLLANHRR